MPFRAASPAFAKKTTKTPPPEDTGMESAYLKALGEKHELHADAGDELMRGSFLRTFPGLQPCDGFFVSTLQRVE